MLFRPVLATLGYILSPDRQQVLMIQRNKRPDDLHFGKYNGLGGRLEPHEDVVSGMRREIREESGLEAEELVLRGTISWPGFGKNGEDWFGFIFRIERWSGQPHAGNHEGTLVWVPLAELERLPLWPGDRYFLSMVFDDDPRAFHGCMPYQNGQPQGWSYVRV
ncbi:MAG: 8-oxo-dGTP diphosphatase [Thermogemmatispora sp.]|uniref:NUDIX hydrolase n=1 Tax=Thermogemmatispora sp. TaxID=1968838 RepID=UPI003432DCE0|nr:8-oxo-dGTP diphosphatase [Thermogemmatispora sp.]